MNFNTNKTAPRDPTCAWFTGPSDALVEIRAQAALLLTQERRERKSMLRLLALLAMLALSAPLMAIATVGDEVSASWSLLNPGVLAFAALSFIYIFSRYLEQRCADIPMEARFSNGLHIALRRNWVDLALLTAEHQQEASEIDRLIVDDLKVIHESLLQQREIKPQLIGEGLRLGK
jgi:hypothetical protein